MSQRNFIHNEKGVALLEFAVLTPLLLLLFLGTAEFTRFIIIQEKVERTAYALSGIIVQYLPDGTSNASKASMLSVDNMNDNVFAHFPKIMDPYVDPKDFRAIASSVLKASANAGDIRIKWQIASKGKNGRFTDKNTTKSIVNGLLPDDITTAVQDTIAGFTPATIALLSTMQKDENMIVVEVFYRYTPLFKNFLNTIGASSLAETTIVSRVYSMPRQGSLLTLPPQFN